jgi:hypothetical protein
MCLAAASFMTTSFKFLVREIAAWDTPPESTPGAIQVQNRRP